MAQLFYDPEKTFEDNLAHMPWLDKVDYKQPTGKPQFTVLGNPVYLPFGIAASALVISSDQVKAGFDRGFDVITFKTQRSVPFPVHKFPNVIPADVRGSVQLDDIKKGLVKADNWGTNSKEYTIINSFGNPSRGPDHWLPDLKKAASSPHNGQILIASVVGTIQPGFNNEDYYSDFANTASIANKADVAAIEVDLSCANVASEAIVCFIPEAVNEIVRLVREAIGKTPLIIKLAYYSADQQNLLEGIIKDIASYINGVSAINAIGVPIRKKDGTEALPGRLVAGLSGTGIKWAALDMVKRLAKIRSDNNFNYEIIGIGGVMNGDDFKEMRAAGADCVQAVTGVLRNSNLAAEIKKSLKD